MSICWAKRRRSTNSVSPLMEMSAEHQNLTGGCESATLFKPLAWLLRLSGLMYNADLLCDLGSCSCRKDADREEVVPLAKPPSRLRKWTRIGYMVVVHGLPCSIVIKILFCFDQLTVSLLDASSQLRIIFFLMVTSSSFAMTAMTFSFSFKLPNLARQLCFIRKKYSITKAWSLKAVVRFGTLAFLSAIALPIGLGAGILLAPSRDWLLDSVAGIMICPYDIDLHPSWPVLLSAWFSLSVALSMVSAIFCMFFYVWFCRVASSLFDDCSRRLRRYSSEDGLHGKSRLLLTVVQFHGDICDLTHMGNGMFKYFVLAMYCMTIPSTCLNVNVIFNLKSGSPPWMNAIWDQILMLFLIAIIVLSACVLSSKVRKGIDLCVHNISFDRNSQQRDQCEFNSSSHWIHLQSKVETFPANSWRLPLISAHSPPTKI